MGKGSRLKAERLANAPIVTHEPDIPVNWPHGHVAVTITDDEEDECIEVTIHGVRHLPHSTTARALSDMLDRRLEEWNTRPDALGLPRV